MAKTKIDEWMNELDVLPSVASRYAEIERIANGIAHFYGFEKIVPAMLESMATFSPLVRAGIMDERPIVQCKSRTGEEFILSPSGALGAVRAYFSHRMQALPHPVKLFFHTQGFSFQWRGGSSAPSGDDRVIAHNEWGLVMIGEEGLIAEAEIAQIFYRTTAELGINDGSIELRLNAVGCSVCYGSFRSALANYFRRYAVRLCARSKRDLKRAPTRIFSCREERCRGLAALAPQVLDFLCERCKKQLRSLLEFLDEARIPYFLDARFFRDGSWYTEIIYELLLDRTSIVPVLTVPESVEVGGAIVPPAIVSKSMVSPSATASQVEDTAFSGKCRLAEGGRISQVAELLGAKELRVASGVLFLDAIADAVQRKEVEGGEHTEVFFVQLGELAKRRSFEILESLREGEIEIKESLGRDSIKIQLKIAERLGSRFALILGQKEALDGTIIVREVESGIQETVQQEKLVDFLKKKLKKQ